MSESARFVPDGSDGCCRNHNLDFSLKSLDWFGIYAQSGINWNGRWIKGPDICPGFRDTCPHSFPRTDQASVIRGSSPGPRAEARVQVPS
jgi:hypothetical protein